MQNRVLELQSQIRDMEARMVNVDLNGIAMDNQYRAIAKLKKELEKALSEQIKIGETQK